MEPLVAEEALRNAVAWLMRLVEGGAAFIIASGAVVAFGRFLLSVFRRQSPQSFTPIRLDLGRTLVLGIEFQLAADLLRTSVAPTFREIGQLAAVAAIRTALNFFLGREIREERRDVEARSEKRGDTAGPIKPEIA